MTRSVLRPQDPTDRAKWIALLDALPAHQRDLHYHPDYLAIYERTYPETAHLIVWHGGQGALFQPVIARPVPGTARNDLSSVYGYGGPLSVGEVGPDDIDAFQDALLSFAAGTGAVAEFCLLHPAFTDAQSRLLPKDNRLTYRKEVVVADLSASLPEIWARIEERQRKAALTARKAGIEIATSDLSDAHMDAYHQLYLRTMQAVGARPFWHFPDRYFHNCRDCLGPENVTLFNAVKDGRVVASFFHVHMYDTVYYHFSCSEPDARKLNPTALLMLDSLIWAKSAGFRLFHMGGGRTDGADSLFTFKHAFSGQTLPLYSTQRILDPIAYERLTAATKLRETEAHGAPLDSAFFPRYRLQS